MMADGKHRAVPPLGAQPHPLEGPWTVTNALSRLQISWVWPLLRLGSTRPLASDCVWSSPPGLGAKEVGTSVEARWLKERLLAVQSARAPQLGWMLFGLVRRPCTIYLTGSLFCGIGFILAPLFLQAFLSGLKQRSDQTALMLCGVPFILCWAVISASVGFSKFNAQFVGVYCRSAVQRLIYCACLAMPLDAAAGLANPTNLMSIDAERFFAALNVLFPHAFVLVVAFPVLLIFQLGIAAAIACLVSALGTTMAQKRIATIISKRRQKVMLEADKRLKLTEQFLEGIRVLKMNGWTLVAQHRLANVRKIELEHQRSVLFWKGINLTMGLASPAIVGFCVFAAHTLSGGRMLPERVFPALMILRVLQIFLGFMPTAFSAIAELTTSYKRVRCFLMACNWEQTDSESGRCGNASPGTVALNRVVWSRCSGGSRSALEKAGPHASFPRSFRLGPIDLKLRSGELCVVCGPVGSGKSTLLLGMLSELRPESGELSLAGNVALCAQEHWIRSATLRDNVRCLRPGDETAYQAAIQAAQLLADLDALPAADETEIGARGINISGGQRARVALARAIFGADAGGVIFLDDVLSAVDAHVAQSIVKEALLGSLRDSTRILVANTFLPLLLPHAHQVVVLGPRGSVEVVAPPKVALATSPWLQEIVRSMGGCDLTDAEFNKSVQTQCTMRRGEQDPDKVEKPVVANDGSLLVAEDRAIGVLELRSYMAYFRGASPSSSALVGAALFVAILTLVVFAEGARTSTELWVTYWTEDVNTLKGDGEHQRDSAFWLCGYAALVLVLFVVLVLRVVVFTFAIVAISWQIHSSMIERILRASVPLFFDVVPLGRILNRFSKDLDAVDSQLPDAMSEFLQAAAYVLAIFVVCASASYYMLVAMVPLLMVFVRLRRFYSATSRELKRLEAISRSPLYTHFQETLSGLVHIRAFGLSERMLEEFERKVDDNVKIFVHQYALVPWLMYRVNMLATALISAVLILAIILHGTLDPLLVGLSLSAGAGLLGRLHMCVTFSIETENSFTSVERLEHFKHVEQEEDELTIAEIEPPQSHWPDCGEVIFEGVQLKYRAHLPLVLDGVSFRVLGGQRAGIIGRTGSGKSTCMLALLRIIKPIGGRILIDGVDVATVPLQLLRSHAVAIIPQDPYLFAGTIHENLDPLGIATEAECTAALASARLSEVVEVAGGLGAAIHDRGANFSVGQRQLLCIARAMLRQARVVLLDEASANIDAGTDLLIQQAIHTCFNGSTMLIIAHRLSTVMDADLILCMDRGRVVESGPPGVLLQAGGPVAKMFHDAGQAGQPASLVRVPALSHVKFRPFARVAPPGASCTTSLQEPINALRCWGCLGLSSCA